MLGDAEFGDNGMLRQDLHRAGLPYALGISSPLTVFRDAGTRAVAVRAHRRAAATDAPGASSRGAMARNRPWRAHFAALRVTPAQRWPHRRCAPEVWLLCERDLGATPRIKHYFVALPATASRNALVRFAHQRWAIEQQYQELKDELGLDYFEGRSFTGWHRHVVLTALVYTWLQHERRRAGRVCRLCRRSRRDHRDSHRAFFVTLPHYLKNHAEIRGIRSANLTK